MDNFAINRHNSIDDTKYMKFKQLSHFVLSVKNDDQSTLKVLIYKFEKPRQYPSFRLSDLLFNKLSLRWKVEWVYVYFNLLKVLCSLNGR